MFRYYSTQRPVGPGSFPRKDGCIVHNFDNRQEVPEAGCEAWGYIDYPEPLTEREAASYELLDGRLKTWYGVVTTFDDHGRVTAALVDVKQAVVQPENTSVSSRRKDIYIDWYATREEAEEAVEEARRA